jgi:hypothetical protein
MRQPAFRVLRELRNGARRDIPNRLGSDTTTIHAADADAAIKQAKAFGITGTLIAIPEAN